MRRPPPFAGRSPFGWPSPLATRGGGGGAPAPGVNEVWVSIGQSNTVGYAFNDGGARHPAGVLQLGYHAPNAGAIIAAPTTGAAWRLDHVEVPSTAMGPDMQFSIEYMAANPNNTLLWIANASGGTQWPSASPLVDETISRTNAFFAANPGYVLGGFIYIQGEADANRQMSSETYAATIKAMFARLRSEIIDADETTPVIVGEIYQNYDPNYTAQNADPVEPDPWPGFVDAWGEAIRVVHRDIANLIPGAACAVSSASGGEPELTSRGDEVHYAAASQRIMGARMFSLRAAAMANVATLPGVVSALSVGTETAAGVPLTWTAPATGVPRAVSYTVERSPAGAGTWAAIGTATGLNYSTAVSYTDTQTVASRSYDYRVSAVNSAGTGAASATVTATTPAPPTSTVEVLAASYKQVTSGGTTKTFSAVTSAPGWAYISVYGRSTNEVLSVTADGRPATRVSVNHASTPEISADDISWWAVKIAGTTTTIVAELETSSTRVTALVYSTGYGGDPTATTSAVTTRTGANTADLGPVTLDVVADGAILAHCIQTNADTMSITSPLVFDIDCPVIGGSEYNNGASGAIASTVSAFGVTLSYGGSNAAATALSVIAVHPV